MTALPAAQPRVPLNLALVIDAALDLAFRHGVDAVSMRRLAAQLGIEAMSLYHYVPSRAVLPTLMTNRSLSRLPDPDPAQPWDEQLLHLLTKVYRAGVNSPAVVQVLTGQLPYLGTAQGDPGAAAALVSQMLRTLHASPVPAGQQLAATRGLFSLLIGALTAHQPAPAPLPPFAKPPVSLPGYRPPADQSRSPAPAPAADPPAGARRAGTAAGHAMVATRPASPVQSHPATIATTSTAARTATTTAAAAHP